MIRSMKEEDFAPVYDLVKATGTLDVHTVYTYWVMSSMSPELMLVADEGGEITGFIAGFGPYKDAQTAFIWQLGVLPRNRGLRGMGLALLLAFHERSSRLGFRRYACTIAPGNVSSRRLVRRFAQSLNADLIAVGETGSFGDNMTSELIYNIQIKGDA